MSLVMFSVHALDYAFVRALGYAHGRVLGHVNLRDIHTIRWVIDFKYLLSKNNTTSCYYTHISNKRRSFSIKCFNNLFKKHNSFLYGTKHKFQQTTKYVAMHQNLIYLHYNTMPKLAYELVEYIIYKYTI